MKLFATISALLINCKIHMCCPYTKQRQIVIKEVKEELKKSGLMEFRDKKLWSGSHLGCL